MTGKNGRFVLRRVYRHLPLGWDYSNSGAVTILCYQSIGNCFYSGLARMRSGSYMVVGAKRWQITPPQVMQQTALQIGTAILNREAHDDAVLHAILVLLPPPQRILWPKTSLTEIIFMEHLL